MPFFIDSPNPEDDYAARLGRRLQLEVELSTLTFDDVRVFEQLHLDRVAASLVEGCVEALNKDQYECEARREVESTIGSVIREEIEYEETRQDEQERWDLFSGWEYREVRHFSAEKEMYKPTTFILEYIIHSRNPLLCLRLVHSQRLPNHRRRSAHARFAHRYPRLRSLRTPLVDIITPTSIPPLHTHGKV
ncbi:hypothetical protein BJ912DRAFT_1044842 [Pholiota molesta]|nr:hypothetical protein BJ912DRAFT_1044842 [Pholiota molesta]